MIVQISEAHSLENYRPAYHNKPQRAVARSLYHSRQQKERAVFNMLKIYLTNLGKYNEGYLIGEWVELPVSDDELEKVLERIEIGGMYEETFITDYETDVDGVNVHEYDSIEELNELAEALEGLDKYDMEVVEAMLSEGYELEEALERKDDCIVWTDCDDMEDVARAYCEECGVLDDIPDNLQCYFDFQAFGRDMSFEGQYVFTSSGNCVQIL